jgi:ubiquinone/menaquinone biosynthesis C-methylase UbiE
MYYWKEFIEEISRQLKPGCILLDAGAGDCHWKKHFDSNNIKYIGMDLGVGDDECNYSSLDIKGNLTSIPLDNNSVDTIICIQVLEHLPEPWKVIAEFNRVLKKEGHLFISCPQGEPQHQVPYDFFRYTPFGLRSLLNSNGFEVVWIKPQLGNFNRIINDFNHSINKITNLSNNSIKRLILKLINLCLRTLWKIQKPILHYFDQFEQLQDNVTGHFVRAQKVK